MVAISFENARYTYDGQVPALDGVCLQVRTGSFTCVLGGNGSGKSTLAKHVNALLVPDEGVVRVLGKDTADAECTYFIRSHAGMVFQNPDDQLVASLIEDDVAFGPENLGVDPPAIRERVTAALRQVGLQGFEQRQTAALSGGQKQRVAIAGVLAMDPQVLVLDEASAMLDPRGRAGLLRVCRELNGAGLTVVLVTHFMEEAAEADHVVVLDAGRVALEGAPDDVFSHVDELQALALEVPFAARMSRALQERGVPVATHAREADLERDIVSRAGDAVAIALPEARPEGGRHPAEPAEGDAVVEFQGVSFTYEPVSQARHGRARRAGQADEPADWGRGPGEYWALHDLTFSVARGEVLGIAGHTGSGKSTLIQLANGLLQPTEGRVLAGGSDLSDKRAAVQARRDVGVVFQYPERQLFAATVFDDVAFGPRNLGLTADEVERRVESALRLVHLSAADLRDRSPFALSGGQQRRVAFAGVLAMQPSTLVLDEPMAGLDPRARQSFLSLVRELHDQRGLTIVMVSHDMDDLARLCDRVLVLNRGEAIALGAPEEVFADEAALKRVGLGVPHAAHLAYSLRSAGLDMSGLGALPTAGELADEIARALGRGA